LNTGAFPAHKFAESLPIRAKIEALFGVLGKKCSKRPHNLHRVQNPMKVSPHYGVLGKKRPKHNKSRHAQA
jgi:hypothetical protein